MKDNFSHGSEHYASFRPQYPAPLIDYLIEFSGSGDALWDCGTGNGQLATKLAPAFKKVDATDLSKNQIDNAEKVSNVQYSVQHAEKTNFEAGGFDLITVAQAIHWFDFDRFYAEVRRTSKKTAHLVVLGYGLHYMDDELDRLTRHFYENIVGPYWDPERRYLEEKYQTIPFPFDEIKTPEFEIEISWDRDGYLGYLNTWSALKHYRDQTGTDPFPEFERQIKSIWKAGHPKSAFFPLFLRIGKIH